MRVLAAEEQLHLGPVPAQAREVLEELALNGEERILVLLAERVADIRSRHVMVDEVPDRLSLARPMPRVAIGLKAEGSWPAVLEGQVHDGRRDTTAAVLLERLS